MERYPVIDNQSSTPVFLQIEHQVQEMVLSGVLKAGSRLPSERQMAEKLGLSRGTVKKAYENLMRTGFLEIRRGAGCFVRESVTPPVGRLENAQKIINTAIFELEKLRFSHREISNIFSSELSNRIDNLRKFSVLTIDCNPEALDVYQIQLASLTHVNHRQMLLSNLENEEDPTGVLKNFDLIITTAKHHEQILNLAPSLRDRIVSVGVSPSPETLVLLGSIRPHQSIGIIYRSQQFFEIVAGWIKQFHPGNHISGFDTVLRIEDDDFLENIDVLIVPSSGSGTLSMSQVESVRRLRERGGTIVRFEYQIEAGSLSFLEKMFLSLTVLESKDL